MFFRFSFTFMIIFTLPVVADYSICLYKALIKHSLDLFMGIGLIVYMRWMKSLDSVINFFFGYVSFSHMVAFMMLNPQDIDPIGFLWAAFFLALSALLQRGRARLLYCLFLGWIPVVYVLVNMRLDGALTLSWLAEESIPDPPLFLLFIPMVMLIIAIWSHSSTIQTARDTITAQKRLIEEKNKDITDSIHYAKRIQQSLLPTEKYIERKLREARK